MKQTKQKKGLNYWGFFSMMLALLLLAALTSLVVPVFLQLCENKNVTLSAGTLLLLFGVLVLAKIFSILITVVRERFAEAFNKRNCLDMLDDMLHMNYDDLTKTGPTSLFERISMSVNNIYEYMTGGFIDLWSSVILVIACLVFVVRVDWQVAGVLTLLIPVNYFGYRLLNKELCRRSVILQEKTSESFQEIVSYVQQVDYLKQLSSYDPILRNIHPSVDKMYNSMASVNVYAQSVSAILGGINDVARNFSLIYLAFRFVSDQADAYMLLTMTAVLPLYFSAMGGVVNANMNRQVFQVAVNFHKSLKEQREPMDGSPLASVEEIQLEIEHLHVPGKVLPFKAKATVHKGDIVQICGDSGTGKSTLAKALIRFRDSEGISVNGIPLGQLRRDSLRDHMEYLSQNIPIVHGTLRDNLFLQQEWSQELEDHLLSDPVLETILQSKAMDTVILEGGANLSGGEKQKIALARALLSDADVLILDEICSNIDEETSNAIYRRIQADRENRIVFIISHEPLPQGLANMTL